MRRLVGFSFMMILFGLIVSFIMFLLILPITVFAYNIPLVECIYLSLSISSIGVVAVIIVSISDKLKYRRKKSCLCGDLMFEMLVSMLKEELPDISFELEGDTHRLVKIPGPCDDIGEITIYADPGDVIVGVGDLFHVHFRVDWTGENEDAEAAAISEAIKYVKDVMADKVVLRQKYRNEKLVSASAFYADNGGGSGWIGSLAFENIFAFLLRRKTEVKNYVWSGPYKPDQ